VLVLLVAASGQATATTPPDLVQAYKKEFAFLEAEKRALGARLDELDRSSNERIQQAQAAVQTLQARVLALRAEADRLERSIQETDASDPAAGETDAVAETLDRARDTLSQRGITLPPTGEGEVARVASLRRVFDHAVRLMRQGGRLVKTQDKFFLPEGKGIAGAVIHVGDIAAYGVSEQGSGALAPAGEGRLKLWPSPLGTLTARALAAGRHPTKLGMFVYESLDQAAQPKQQRSPIEVVQAGGLVAWIIVSLGILAVLLIAARSVTLWRAATDCPRLLAQLQPLLGAAGRDRALELCEHSRGAVGRVLRVAVANLDRERSQLEDRVEEAMLAETARLERFGAAINVFAAVAPLLGLLGTVTGMIATFDVITVHGTGDPKLLSGGISEALITTELGLLVAIPTLLVGTLLSGRARTIIADMERAALQVVNASNGALPATDAGGEERPVAAPARGLAMDVS
jgi:biopolymer transport protein ExbB